MFSFDVRGGGGGGGSHDNVVFAPSIVTFLQLMFISDNMTGTKQIM